MCVLMMLEEEVSGASSSAIFISQLIDPELLGKEIECEAFWFDSSALSIINHHHHNNT